MCLSLGIRDVSDDDGTFLWPTDLWITTTTAADPAMAGHPGCFVASLPTNTRCDDDDVVRREWPIRRDDIIVGTQPRRTIPAMLVVESQSQITWISPSQFSISLLLLAAEIFQGWEKNKSLNPDQRPPDSATGPHLSSIYPERSNHSRQQSFSHKLSSNLLPAEKS